MDGDSSFDLSSLVGSCVKLIVVKKENFLKFDKLVDSLYTCNCVELKIVEDFSEFEDDAVGDDVELAVDDTMTLLRDYIDNTVTDLDKNKLTSVVQTLYVEAQHME